MTKEGINTSNWVTQDGSVMFTRHPGLNMYAFLMRSCFQTNKKIQKLTSLFLHESRKFTSHCLSIPYMQRITLQQSMKYLQKSAPFLIQTSSFYLSSPASKMKKVEEPEKRELDLLSTSNSPKYPFSDK
ncbi:transmembrane protein 69 isoform X3 [Mobula hypostoma]|uniref:transmembrane protein 69 isoform X3 n=1 Tax=Mobula hypostoma TaxID=723540 RepID=UPI002FC2DDD5